MSEITVKKKHYKENEIPIYDGEAVLYLFNYRSSLNFSLSTHNRRFNCFETNSVDKETIVVIEMRQNESKVHGL